MSADRSATGVFAGLIRPRGPRDPRTQAIVAKVASDVRAVVGFVAQAILEGQRSAEAARTPPSIREIRSDERRCDVIDAEFVEDTENK